MSTASALSLGRRVEGGFPSPSVDKKVPRVPPVSHKHSFKRTLLTKSVPYHCLHRLNVHTYKYPINQKQSKSRFQQVLPTWPGRYLQSQGLSLKSKTGEVPNAPVWS